MKYLQLPQVFRSDLRQKQKAWTVDQNNKKNIYVLLIDFLIGNL